MKSPIIDLGRKEIQEIRLLSNEFLTVWVQDGNSNIQVELRVTPEGRPEIYCDKTECVKTFREWYNMTLQIGELKRR